MLVHQCVMVCSCLNRNGTIMYCLKSIRMCLFLKGVVAVENHSLTTVYLFKVIVNLQNPGRRDTP